MSICSVAKHFSLDPFWEDEAGYWILNAWRIVFILWPNTGTDSLVKKETRVGEGGEAEQVRQLGPRLHLLQVQQQPSGAAGGQSGSRSNNFSSSYATNSGQVGGLLILLLKYFFVFWSSLSRLESSRSEQKVKCQFYLHLWSFVCFYNCRWCRFWPDVTRLFPVACLVNITEIYFCGRRQEKNIK